MNVLIDNERLIQISWKLRSESAGLDLFVFSSISEFIQNTAKIEQDANIYVDSDLGDGKKGEVESKLIADRGYKNIWLCTGFSDINLAQYPWIKAIVSKRPPF